MGHSDRSGNGSLFTFLILEPFSAGFEAFAFFSAGRSSLSSVSPAPTDFSGDFLVLFLEAGALYGTKGEVPEGALPD